MTNNTYTELSHSEDCEKHANQFIQEFPLRRAEIGQGTVIKRALPSRQAYDWRMVLLRSCRSCDI